MKTIRNFPVGLTIAIAIAVTLIVTFELALRFVPAGQGYYLVDGGTEQRAIRLPLLAPNARLTFKPPREYLDARTEGLPSREYVVETDTDGFIKPGRLHADPDITIAFLGGSTTENFLVPAEARFPHLAGQQIAACTNQRVNTINAGRSGITSMHSLNIFLNTIVPLRPDFAVMMHNINDYAMLHHEGSYWNDHPGRSLLSTFSTRPSEPVGRFARLANLLVPRTVNFLRARVTPTAPPTDPHAARWGTPKPIDVDRITENFARSLETFIHAARSWDIDPILMTMPDRWPEDFSKESDKFDEFISRKVFAIDDYSVFKNGFNTMNETVRRTAERFEVPVIDLASEIGRSPLFMFDPIHFNEARSRKAAEVISTTMCMRPN
jgi:lysophospholipase L1-like esterase